MALGVSLEMGDQLQIARAMYLMTVNVDGVAIASNRRVGYQSVNQSLRRPPLLGHRLPT